MIKYEADHPKWLPYAILGTFSIGVFIQLFILGALSRKINVEKISAVSNPETGKTEFAEFVASNKTTAASVTRFLVQWKIATFSSNGKNPDGTPDKGRFVAGQLLTSPMAMGMEFVVQPFQDAYVVGRSRSPDLKRYSTQEMLATGSIDSRIDPSIDINGLVEISSGVWTAEVISTQIYSNRRTKEGEAYIMREKIELEVISPRVKIWQKEDSAYSSVFKELEQQRLMIKSIMAMPT